MLAVFLQSTVGFELNDGWRISSVPVGVDDLRLVDAPAVIGGLQVSA
jgi:hypothetical protein